MFDGSSKLALLGSFQSLTVHKQSLTLAFKPMNNLASNEPNLLDFGMWEEVVVLQGGHANATKGRGRS